MSLRGLVGTVVLLVAVAGVAFGLVVLKKKQIDTAVAAGADRPEPTESVSVAIAQTREHRRTTTAIGTVWALRSIALKIELAGTVKTVSLTPGQIVEPGTILVALDVSVEEAELKSQEAQLVLAETVLNRARRASSTQSVPIEEVDKALAQRDVSLAQIAKSKAIIARKTIRAPFKARIGISDIHPGQYLGEGTQLTTLQGVDPAVHVDFPLPQTIAATLKEGDAIEVFSGGSLTPVPAKVVAVDARVDPATRNAMVRARVDHADGIGPGAAVRVRVPAGPAQKAVAVSASALRKGPDGDHVFVIEKGPDGKSRAKARPVEVATAVGDDVFIAKGLNAGETVATSGSFKLRDGLVVVPNESK
jgi:membrane fusion protein (multidrug efflux system)